jgi:hypothetical protein
MTKLSSPVIMNTLFHHCLPSRMRGYPCTDEEEDPIIIFTIIKRHEYISYNFIFPTKRTRLQSLEVTALVYLAGNL